MSLTPYYLLIHNGGVKKNPDKTTQVILGITLAFMLGIVFLAIIAMFASIHHHSVIVQQNGTAIIQSKNFTPANDGRHKERKHDDIWTLTLCNTEQFCWDDEVSQDTYNRATVGTTATVTGGNTNE